MSTQLPASVGRVIWLLRALVAWSGLIALLTYVQRDDLIRTWAEGNSAARAILRERGLEALKQSSINIPGFAPVALVLFVVFAALAGVLVAFFRAGHSWARIAITAAVAFLLLSAAAGLLRHLPPLFVGLSGVGLVLALALLVSLWQRATGDYMHPPVTPSP